MRRLREGADLCDSRRHRVDISPPKLDTLEDLLRAIRRAEPEGSHLLTMLGTTAAHLVNHLGEPPDKISIRKLVDVRPGLKAFLKARRFTRSSTRSYCGYARILLQRARALGWVECSPELLAEWQPIRAAVKKAVGCKRIIEYALARGISPRDFTEAHLAEWAQAAVRAGLVYEYVRIMQANFRRLISNAGLSSAIPGLRPPFDNRYGVSFSELPNSLRNQILDLLKWKMAEFSVDRPRRAKI